MSEKKVCIVIPIYKKTVTNIEMSAIKNNIYKFVDLTVYFIAPECLDCGNYSCEFPEIKILRYENKYFKSTLSYNKLMLQCKLYEDFINYNYICICQPDVWVIGNSVDLLRFVDMGYDYIGAPWYPNHFISSIVFKPGSFGERYITKLLPKRKLEVGNGGFSLRNVKNTIKLLKEKKCQAKHCHMAEDYFFSYYGLKNKSGFSIAPERTAKCFALETKAKEIIMENKELPLAVHAWEKYFPDIRLMLNK